MVVMLKVWLLLLLQDEFERFFAPPQSDENLFVRSLVTAAAVLGVGALAAIVAR